MAQDFDTEYLGSEEDSNARVRVDGSLNVHLAFPDASRHPDRPKAFHHNRLAWQFGFDHGRVRCLSCFKDASFEAKSADPAQVPKDLSKRSGFFRGLPGTPICKNPNCPTNRPELE